MQTLQVLLPVESCAFENLPREHVIKFAQFISKAKSCNLKEKVWDRLPGWTLSTWLCHLLKESDRHLKPLPFVVVRSSVQFCSHLINLVFSSNKKTCMSQKMWTLPLRLRGYCFVNPAELLSRIKSCNLSKRGFCFTCHGQLTRSFSGRALKNPSRRRIQRLGPLTLENYEFHMTSVTNASIKTTLECV